MTEIQGKSILVRVSEGSSYRESTVSALQSIIVPSLLLRKLFMCRNLLCRGFGKTRFPLQDPLTVILTVDTKRKTMKSVNHFV